MSEGIQPGHRSGFEIAIICALPSEAEAVEESFDEYWDDDGTVYGKAAGDPNAYTTGRIGRHNVVLAWMPGMGNTSAANVASSLRSSFSNIRLALVVGICGGVPRGPKDQEIILGDVIISNGLVQYDFGRQYTDGFKRKSEVNDTLGRQNQEIRGFMNKLQVGRSKKRLLAKTMEYLTTISELKYPGAAHDRLFPSGYRHKHQNPADCDICKQCNTSSDRVCDIALEDSCTNLKCAEVELITRKRLEGNVEYQGPMVHYGKIASGNRVVISGEYRDKIAAQEKVIAFEMEGAGVWDNFPCIVIKGVCDYADSHKGYDWQAYAATTAAAVAKAFLGEWTPSNVPDEDKTLEKCLDSLSFPEMDYRRQEVAGTALDSSQWLFEHKSYTSWLSKQHGLLWITGKPGSGKSTLMKLIFNRFKQQNATDVVHLTFFFHRRGTQLQQTELGMLRTLLYQVLQQVPTTRAHFQKSFKEKILYYGQARTDWNWDESELRNIFKSALLTVVESHSIFIFVDALDEGGEILARKVVEYLNQIDDSLANYDKDIHICFSCRHWPVIRINRGYKICLENENYKDISLFALQEFQKRIQDPEDALVPPSLIEILDEITEKASGVFLWVALVIPNIAQQYNNGDSIKEIKSALSRVPTDLKHVFKHILTELKNSDKRDQSLNLMQWICLVKTPLTLTKLRHALASDDSAVKWPQESVRDSIRFVEDDARMRRLLRSLSGGLAELKSHKEYETILTPYGPYIKNNFVQFIHQSVLDYMLRDGLKLLDISLTKDPIGKGHDRLAKSCINYFSFGEVRILQTKSKQEIDQMLGKLPFIKYAAENWPSHSGQADKRFIDQSHIIQRLGWCKDRSFVHWGALCSVLSHSWQGSLSTANTSLLHVAATFNITSIITHGVRNSDLIEAQDSKGNRPLHCAAQAGHYKSVKMFINAHTMVEARNKNGCSPLQRAASGGHVNILRLLLDVGRVPATEETVLCAAVSCGSVSSVKLLLERGADANAQGDGYTKPLGAAVNEGYESIARLLIENGADVNAHGGHINFFNAAVDKGYEGIVRLFIENGANANTKDPYYGNVLNAVLNGGYKGIARLLIENGANVNTKDPRYGNILNAAVNNGYEGIARLLIENGADVNTTGRSYGSALEGAVDKGYEDIARLLIENGADVNATGRSYGSALEGAVDKGYEDMARLLIENGADVNATDGIYNGGNALCVAAYRGNEIIVKLFIENGVDINAQGGRYGNALYAAIRWSNRDIARLLLENGAKLESVEQQGWKAFHFALRSGLWNEELMKEFATPWTDKDNQGCSSIHFAASGGCVKGLERILEFQGDINASDKYGWTAAHWAARSGSRKCCKLLGEAGCDFTKRDNDGLTASEIAIYCSNNGLHDILDPYNKMLAESRIVVYEKLVQIKCICCFHEVIGPYLECCQVCCFQHYYLCFRCLHFKSDLHPEHDSWIRCSTRRKKFNGIITRMEKNISENSPSSGIFEGILCCWIIPEHDTIISEGIIPFPIPEQVQSINHQRIVSEGNKGETKAAELS